MTEALLDQLAEMARAHKAAEEERHGRELMAELDARAGRRPRR